MAGHGISLGLLATALVAVCLSLDAPVAQGEGRFEQFTKKFAKSPDQARVLAAGYLGGAGTEWLVGGGFQHDGTVVLAGVSFGPKLELDNVQVGVLGTDTPPPAAPERQRRDVPALALGACVLSPASSMAFLVGLLALTGGQGADKKLRLPPAGTEFRFSPEQPKYATCDIEFRDLSETFWPCFFYGKPGTNSTMTVAAAGPAGAFSLLCDQMTQKNGDQNRRVLGELVKNGKPPVVRLTIKELRPLDTEPAEGSGKSKKMGEFAPAQADLEVDGKKVSVQAKASFTWKWGKSGDSAESVAIELRFRLKPADLGLTRMEGPIECRAGITGYAKK